jgi:hypothetical protein
MSADTFIFLALEGVAVVSIVLVLATILLLGVRTPAE